MWTVSACQQHPNATFVCDEDATLELRVKTVKYFQGEASQFFCTLNGCTFLQVDGEKKHLHSLYLSRSDANAQQAGGAAQPRVNNELRTRNGFSNQPLSLVA